MAKKVVEFSLSAEIMIEMVAINKKTSIVHKKNITISNWRNLKRVAGYNYYAFQLGFSSY
jgi:hypothetical protein